VKPRIPSAANNAPENTSARDSDRTARENAGDDSPETEDTKNLLRRGVHHVRRGLNRAGVPQIAGHATRISRHGWRRISTAVASANSGGRLSRPVSAMWGRVARRTADGNAPAGDNPHGHRNRRLAFDFAVGTAVIAIFFVVHHQFYLRSHRPRVVDLLASNTEVAADPAAGEPRPETPPHHRRRTHRSEQPPNTTDVRPNDAHRDAVAVADHPTNSDGGAEFGGHADISHRADHPVQPPPTVQVQSPPLESQPHDAKQAADASLDSLLAAPVNSGSARPGDAAAPIAQTEPAPSHDLDKPARPHGTDDPLLVDSRDAGSSLPPKHEPLKPSASAAPLGDDFAAPEAAKPHEHHEHKDHGPKDPPKDDFSMPAPAASDPVGPPKDEEHHHKHHRDDHGAADQTPGANLPADLLAPKLDAKLPDAGPSIGLDNSNPLNSNSEPKPTSPSAPIANDPLLDSGPKLDGGPKLDTAPKLDAAPKDPPAAAPSKPSGDKLEPSKPDHADDGLPVLSVPSPHHADAKSTDDLPARTANANDATIGGSAADSGKSVPKPAETKAPPAGDSSLDELLNSKAPSSAGSTTPATSAPPAGATTPESKPSIPAASPAPANDPKADPFHTDAAPKLDAAPKTDAPLKADLPPKTDTPPKQAEPSLPDNGLPAPKPSAEPLHSAADDESMPSVAVAHHQIEKNELGGSVRYRIVVRNNGKKAVKAFDVDEAVPAEHTVQVTDPPAETRDRDLHWTLRDVAPGEERTIVVTLAPPVRPAERQPVAEPTIAAQPSPTAATVPIEARAESSQVKLELILPTDVHAGESCRIGFRATNLGGQTTDLKLNLDLPEQLHYARGQQLQYKIGALGDHESREDYLTATASGTGQAELRAQLLQAGHSLATAKGTCHVAPAGAPHRGVQQTGAWTAHPGGQTRTADASDCLCWP
jgi:hypothetical protein